VVHRMNQELPFDDLKCPFCSTESSPEKKGSDLEYYLAEVPVTDEDGTEVKVPIDIRELDYEYDASGQYAVRILARVPCPNCGTDHAITAAAIHKAPALEIRGTKCPRCGQKGEIVGGPLLRYREKAPDDAWVEASALMECQNPVCRTKSRGTSTLDPVRFRAVEDGKKLEVTYKMQPVDQGAADVTTLPLATRILERPFEIFSMMHWTKNVMRRELGQPFKGLECLFVLHYLTSLIPFVHACRELGLEPDRAVFFYKSQYRYPNRDSIRAWLQGQGYRTRPVEEIEQHVEEMERAWKPGSPPILIVEDGGYLTPLLHKRNSPLLAYTIGAVEQTTKGLRNTEDWGKDKTSDKNLRGLLQFPLISIPDSNIKTRIEPPLIGNEVVHAIETLTTFSLFGVRVALLGLGTIGMQVFEHLRAKRAIVTGYDEMDDRRKTEFSMAGGTLASSAAEAVRGKRLVIGCSGRRSVTASVLENVQHGGFVVSGSSDLVEIDIQSLEDRSITKVKFGIKDADVVPGQLWGGTRYALAGQPIREINLLADGYPVTFWGAQGMPHEGSDLVMTVILVAAAELAARNAQRTAGDRAPYPNEISRDAVDALDTRYQLSSQHLKLHRPEALR
jgi:S-adenosylhomocysteine hydrolase